MDDPKAVFEGEYVEVVDPQVQAGYVAVYVEFSDTDSMFDDTERWPSFNSVWEYLDDRIPGIREMTEPVGDQGFGILIERDVGTDLEAVVAEVKAVVKGRQEWRGKVPFEDELEEEMLA